MVAPGVGINGIKHPVGPAEGSTENMAVVTYLLTGLQGPRPGHDPGDLVASTLGRHFVQL